MEIIEWTKEALASASDRDVFDYMVGFIRQQGKASTGGEACAPRPQETP